MSTCTVRRCAKPADWVLDGHHHGRLRYSWPVCPRHIGGLTDRLNDLCDGGVIQRLAAAPTPAAQPDQLALPIEGARS